MRSAGDSGRKTIPGKRHINLNSSGARLWELKEPSCRRGPAPNRSVVLPAVNRSLQTRYRTHLWCPGPWLNPTSREQVPIRFLTSLWHSFLVSPASSYWLSESTILSRDPWDNCRSKGCMKSTDGLQGQWLFRLINITPIDSALFIKYSVSFLWV